MDDDEICIDEKYCTVLKIPKAYHGLDKLRFLRNGLRPVFMYIKNGFNPF